MTVIIAVITSILLQMPVYRLANAALIRDTEIEDTIREYASPLLRAAEIDSGHLALHILKDKELNAFVARGRNIFLTTGLLMAAKHPGQLQGVLAHEIGHITGGHLARLSSANKNRKTEALVGQIIGVALGLLAKNPGVAAATGSKAAEVATKKLHKFSRVQERSADQVATKLLDRSQLSSRGLLEFLTLMEGQELLVRSRQDPYVITHPLTRSRINFVKNHVKHSSFSNKRVNRALAMRHSRMLAKLRGFLNAPPRTLRLYSNKKGGVAARYARAIAFYRNTEFIKAIEVLDGLISRLPNDPFFRELKGQILFEIGKLDLALPSYETAVKLLPTAPLIRVKLAHVQLELNQLKLNKLAIENLTQAMRYDRSIPLCWRLAATAYGRNKQLGLSALMSAEYNTLIGRARDAAQQAKKAMLILSKNSPGWLRANDIINSNKFSARRNK